MALRTGHGSLSFMYLDQCSQVILAVVQRSRWGLTRSDIGKAAKSVTMEDIKEKGVYPARRRHN